MTFPDFILGLRRRLQDRYTYTGSLITTANQDGVRWTSSELVDISNNAFQEFSRYILLYGEYPLFKSLQSNLIAFNSGTPASGILNFANPENVLSVLSMSKGAEDDVYGKIDSAKFTTYLAQDKQPRKDEGFFAEFYNITEHKKYLKILPEEDEEVYYTYIYMKNDYDNDDITAVTSLHIVGFDDFLLDIAERECRDREHNWERAQILDKRIIVKLGIPTNG